MGMLNPTPSLYQSTAVYSCGPPFSFFWLQHKFVTATVTAGGCYGLLSYTDAAFFKDKIAAVRASTATTPLYEVPYRATASTLGSWTAVTADEVEQLIASAPNKTCQLDPVPTWLVKDLSGTLAPFIAALFNRSLATGCFPSAFKRAVVVRPLLKKSGLDASEMKNYRPVSNLSFLSKLSPNKNT